MTQFNAIPEELLPLIPGYLDRRKSDIVELKACISEQKFDVCGALSHRLKGVGTSYGFPYITEYGKQMEDAAFAKDSEKLIELIQVLEKQVTETIALYEIWRKEQEH